MCKKEKCVFMHCQSPIGSVAAWVAALKARKAVYIPGVGA